MDINLPADFPPYNTAWLWRTLVFSWGCLCPRRHLAPGVTVSHGRRGWMAVGGRQPGVATRPTTHGVNSPPQRTTTHTPSVQLKKSGAGLPQLTQFPLYRLPACPACSENTRHEGAEALIEGTWAASSPTATCDFQHQNTSRMSKPQNQLRMTEIRTHTV